MNNDTIFTKTAKGLGEALGKTRQLSREQRKILKEIDGKRSFRELHDHLDMNGVKLRKAIEQMLEGDFIREFGMATASGAAAKAAPSMGDTEFGLTMPAMLDAPNSQLTIGDFFRAMEQPESEAEEAVAGSSLDFKNIAKAEAPAAKSARPEVAQTEEARRAIEEEARRITALAQKRIAEQARKEAEDKARFREQQEAKQRAEEEARRAAEEKARREAEEVARRKAEEAARKQAEEKARQEAEAKARAEAERQAKLRAEEEARRKAEEEARRKAEEAARKQAEEMARQEAERQAKLRAEEEARRKAEEEARRAAAEQARREAEEVARRKAEEAARKQAEEKARQEAEAKARAEVERQAKLRAEEEARRKTEEEARRAAEDKARREAEEAARRQGEEKARQDAEAKARVEAEREAKLRAAEEARRKAEEEARREAEKAARLAAEEAARRQAEEEARRLAEEEARRQAEEQARQEAMEQARLRAHEAARRAAEELAQREAEAQQRAEAERQAKLRAEEEARRKAEEEAHRAAEEKARREAEEAARREAEEAARVLAEEKARKKEEEKARKQAEAEARQAAREQARQEATEKARIEAEQKAQRAAEVRAHKEAERLAKQEEKERLRREAEHAARLKAEEAERIAAEKAEAAAAAAEAKAAEAKAAEARMEAEQAAAPAADADPQPHSHSHAQPPEPAEYARSPRWRPPHGWLADVKWALRLGVAALVVLAIAAVALVHVFPFNERLARLQRDASQQFGQPVRIGSMNLSLFPYPQWRLGQIVVGEGRQITIERINARVEFGALLADSMQISELEVVSPIISDEGMGWLLFGKGGAAWSQVPLRASEVRWRSQHVTVPVFSAGIEPGDGGWRKAVLSASNAKARVELQRVDGAWRFEMTAGDLALPFGGTRALDALNASGTLEPDGATISQFTAVVLDGTLSGAARLQWDGGWRLSGEAQARQVDPVRIAPALLQQGVMHAQFRFTMQAEKAEDLFAAPQARGSFSIKDGVLQGIDMAAQVIGQAGSGKTTFGDLGGDFVYTADKMQLSRVRLVAGLLSARGDAVADANGKLTGRVGMDLRTESRQASSSVVLGGTLTAPQFQP